MQTERAVPVYASTGAARLHLDAACPALPGGDIREMPIPLRTLRSDTLCPQCRENVGGFELGTLRRLLSVHGAAANDLDEYHDRTPEADETAEVRSLGWALDGLLRHVAHVAGYRSSHPDEDDAAEVLDEIEPLLAAAVTECRGRLAGLARAQLADDTAAARVATERYLAEVHDAPTLGEVALHDTRSSDIVRRTLAVLHPSSDEAPVRAAWHAWVAAQRRLADDGEEVAVAAGLAAVDAALAGTGPSDSQRVSAGAVAHCYPVLRRADPVMQWRTVCEYLLADAAHGWETRRAQFVPWIPTGGPHVVLLAPAVERSLLSSVLANSSSPAWQWLLGGSPRYGPDNTAAVVLPAAVGWFFEMGRRHAWGPVRCAFDAGELPAGVEDIERLLTATLSLWEPDGDLDAAGALALAADVVREPAGAV